ncbi:MAG: hypothetical protein HOP23_04885 [Methylococcaceae bacterium]|nr:hypothetical protein [Methylococcaceae bacterium]
MLIGKKETFAVEYELDSNHGEEWMFGKICYWINNIQVGDYELGTSLRDVLVAMAFLVPDCGNREGLNLCKLSYEEVFSLLNESIYGGCENTAAHLLDTPARFEAKIPVDVFDQWKIFLIDCNSFSIFLYKRVEDKNVRFVRLLQGEFDDVIRKLYNDLESIYAGVE